MDIIRYVLIFLFMVGTCSGMVHTGRGGVYWNRVLTVDRSGKRGDYVTIQDAIDAVPSNNVDPIFIRIEPGVYREKVIVPQNKPFITLSGRNAYTTVIIWDDGGDIYKSPTVSVFASDFVGRYLTIQNTYGTRGKGVALRITSDRAAFHACRFLSYQDTLLDETGRHFYSNCYIEGATDFIFGDGTSLFQKCHIHSISPGNGAITAQHRMTPEDNSGFYFVRCKVTGLTSTTLGRPWGPYSRVVFSETFMSSVVLPQGWDDWGKPATHRTAYYGEYKCFGPGANRVRRVDWSLSLTSQEALPYMNMNLMDAGSWVMA